MEVVGRFTDSAIKGENVVELRAAGMSESEAEHRFYECRNIDSSPSTQGLEGPHCSRWDIFKLKLATDRFEPN